MHLEVIKPLVKKSSQEINCNICKLMDYTHKDYSLFKHLKKLVFFYLHRGNEIDGPICHYCVVKAIFKGFPEGTKEIEVQVHEGKKIISKKFYEGDPNFK